MRVRSRVTGWEAIPSQLVFLSVLLLCFVATSAEGSPFSEPWIPGAVKDAVVLGRDLDGDGDPDEVTINLEIIEVREEIYPGKVVTFWVFAPVGQGMTPVARVPSPTIRVERGDRVRITLHNTHYLPHTIHVHGTVRQNPMDTRPLRRVEPGQAFTFEFIAADSGTYFYHCHVVPAVHPPMGLVGMFIIEPNRSENNFRHLVPGAGRIEDLAKATLAEGYEREYSLVYIDIDERLNRIPAASKDPQEIEKILHGEHDPTERQPNIFLLNGRSFPFTLRDTPIEVAPEKRVKLRILNARSRAIKLHIHGFNPMLTRVDGHEASARARVARDMVIVSAGQRIDLDLRPGSNALFASGPGVWLMHDHSEQAIINKRINPGGSITTIVYDGFMGEDGLPQAPLSLERWLEPARESGRTALLRETILETHRMVAKSCERPRGFRRIFMKGGTKLARKGEAYAFEPRTIRAKPCEEVEIVFENSDAVRHAMMIPGLNPMFMLAFTGRNTRSARFVTPDEDITLEFHCHVEIHEKMGMRGRLIVGKGGERVAHDEPPASARHLYEGVGVIVAVQPRKSHLVVDQEVIENFMAAMTMGYPVKPAGLLRGLEAGDRVRFAIDADQQVIVKISPLTFKGEGTVISVDRRKGQIVIDHKEIPGFMAAMIMGYPVKSPMLLMDLTAGDRIGFTIDAEQQAIVEVTSKRE